MGAGKLAQRNDEHFGESFANSLSSDRQSYTLASLAPSSRRTPVYKQCG